MFAPTRKSFLFLGLLRAMIQLLSVAATVYLFYEVSTASPIFQRNPDTGNLVGWQSSPNRRGTLDIVFNCLFTIIACTWSVHHFNLPSPKDSFWTLAMRKAKWSALAVLFPEVLLLQAVAERLTAATCLDTFEELPEIHVRRGGWILKAREVLEVVGHGHGKQNVHKAPSASHHRHDVRKSGEVDFTLTHAHYAAMGGFRIVNTAQEASANGRSRAAVDTGMEVNQESVVLNAMQLANGRLNGSIPPITWPSKEEIRDRSKSNAFTKTIALAQICGLLSSIVSRGCQGLAVSQLEVITLAFVGCALLTYGFWWHKPQGVETPIVLEVPLQEVQWAALQRDHVDPLWQMLFTSPGTPSALLDRIPNDSIHMSSALVRPCAIVWAMATTTFGSLNMVAWNFAFPTVYEKWTWRIAAVIAANMPLIPLIINSITATLDILERKDALRFLRTLHATYQTFVLSAPKYENSSKHTALLSRLGDLLIVRQRQDEFQHYRNVFALDGLDAEFRADLEEYVSELDYQDPNYPRFPQELRRLLSIVDDLLDTQHPNKYDEEADLVGLFPKIQRKERRMNDLNLRGLERQKANLRRFVGYIGDDLVKLWPRKVFFWLSAGLYCAARLMILGLAVAGLRRMPSSVYETSWMSNIPTLQ